MRQKIVALERIKKSRFLAFFWFIFLGFFVTNFVWAIELEERSEFGYNQTRLVWRDNVGQNRVAFTFDDVPNQYTSDILEVLLEYQIRATFFLIGNQAVKYPEVTRLIVSSGHEIANHSFSHCWQKEDPVETLIQDIKLAEEKIKKITGETPRFFRPPGGMITEEIKEACGSTGYSVVLWDVDSRDWALNGKEEEIVNNVLSQVEPGSIILFHSLSQTVRVLPQIIEQLEEQNFQIGTVSGLIDGKY
ncbi:MAG: peptidoglycan-N-acetylglucosamine deacetylase [Candidatus Atribacteria bacterium]|nr:peptidoglycan-N-acetylglucosamine deacetylase [Candidatus Atribacteria bacterium]